MNESLEIVLKHYKSGHITKEEAIKLIEDISGKTTYIPTYPYYPQITWQTDTLPVTCKNYSYDITL